MNDTVRATLQAPEEGDDGEMAELELADLKNRADTLGISYHPSIGLEKLKAKLSDYNAREEQEAAERAASEAAREKESAAASENPAVTMMSDARERALALVRVRVTCMDPAKKEYDGEIFSAGNSVVGTVKKFVPFEVDWHVPRIILNRIKTQEYQTFAERRNPRGGSTKTGRLVKAFAVTELPPLTEKELAELRQRQLMARGTADA